MPWAAIANAWSAYRRRRERPRTKKTRGVLSGLRLELAKAALAVGRADLARAETVAIRALWPHRGTAMPDALAAELQALTNAIGPSDER